MHPYCKRIQNEKRRKVEIKSARRVKMYTEPKNILVTGANGYIGNGVVERLLKDGFKVTATDINTGRITKADRLICIDTDIFEIDNPYDFFGKPDVILHLAWRDGFKHDSLTHIIDMPKHYIFLRKLMEAGIARICVMGSVHEVGFFEGCVNENTPTNPQSLYGVSKNALRNALQILSNSYGTIFQWIRGYYIVGNVINGCSVFSKIAQAEKRGEKIFPFTGGKNQFDFLDYDDLCMQISAVVKQEKIVGIINCCSGYPERIGERVERFIKENNYKIKLNYGAFPERPYDSKAVWGDNSRISKILRLQQEIVK